MDSLNVVTFLTVWGRAAQEEVPGNVCGRGVPRLEVSTPSPVPPLPTSRAYYKTACPCLQVSTVIHPPEAQTPRQETGAQEEPRCQAVAGFLRLQGSWLHPAGQRERMYLRFQAHSIRLGNTLSLSGTEGWFLPWFGENP